MEDKNFEILLERIREAVKNNDIETAKELTEEEYIFDYYSVEFLFNAYERGHIEMARFILEKFALYLSQFGCLMSEVVEKGDMELLKFLIKEEFNTQELLEEALLTASTNGNLEIMKYLVEEEGVDVGAFKNNSLIWTARKGHFEAFKYLHEKGADIKRDDEALKAAVSNGKTEIVEYILKHDEESDLRYPLILAAHYGHADIAKILVEAGADNIEEALIEATTMYKGDVVKYLVDLLPNAYAEDISKVKTIILYLEVNGVELVVYNNVKISLDEYIKLEKNDTFKDFERTIIIFRDLDNKLKQLFKKDESLRNTLLRNSHITDINMLINYTIEKKEYEGLKILLEEKIDINNQTLIDIYMLNDKKVNSLLNNFGYFDSIKGDLEEIKKLL